jgi:hypothetical protein
MPGDRTLLSLDGHAIPTRVLRFEDSGLRRRTPVRLVLLTSQTGTVTPAFLAPNKSPNKSCVFSKLSS